MCAYLLHMRFISESAIFASLPGRCRVSRCCCYYVPLKRLHTALAIGEISQKYRADGSPSNAYRTILSQRPLIIPSRILKIVPLIIANALWNATSYPNRSAFFSKKRKRIYSTVGTLFVARACGNEPLPRVVSSKEKLEAANCLSINWGSTRASTELV